MDERTIALYDLYMSVISFIFTFVVVIVPVVKGFLDRRKLAVTFYFSGNHYDRVIVAFTNLSARPINIDYWNLVWQKNYFVYVKYGESILGFYQRNSLTLGADQREEFLLEPEHTSMFIGLHNEGKCKLYVKIQMAGKRRPKLYYISDATLELPFWKKLFQKPQQFRFPE
jgi:hypothetical protein